MDYDVAIQKQYKKIKKCKNKIKKAKKKLRKLKRESSVDYIYR